MERDSTNRRTLPALRKCRHKSISQVQLFDTCVFTAQIYRYAMLHLCWNESSEQRPTFLDLVQQISTTLEEEAGYLDFSRSLSWKNQEQGEYSQSPSGKQKSSGKTEAFEMQLK